jgi:hypothetical protein
LNCHLRYDENARRLHECYEAIGGTAKKSMICDGCGESVNRGARAYAAVLLPSSFHENYHDHKPTEWARAYLQVPI